MRVNSVDIQNELIDIESEVDELANALQLIGTLQDSKWEWLATQGLASGIEKIYTGCERVMAMIASSVDGAPVDHIEGWHVAMLKRMSNPYPDVRPAVISAECHTRLDRLRAFRHRERNSYGLALDMGIVIERAREASSTFQVFKRDVIAFLANA
jgi:hypothetical protein